MIRAMQDAVALPAVEQDSAPEALSMDEALFREFYGETARPLKAYLFRMTGNAALADDLLQESYYRLLRATLPPMDPAQRKNYLYRVATNLVRDHFRSSKFQPASLDGQIAAASPSSSVLTSTDVQRALDQIKPNERTLVWLAYAEGASHREIAAITGLKEASVRPLLFRVRQKLAALLREGGFRKEERP